MPDDWEQRTYLKLHLTYIDLSTFQHWYTYMAQQHHNLYHMWIKITFLKTVQLTDLYTKSTYGNNHQSCVERQLYDLPQWSLTTGLTVLWIPSDAAYLFSSVHHPAMMLLSSCQSAFWHWAYAVYFLQPHCNILHSAKLREKKQEVYFFEREFEHIWQHQPCWKVAIGYPSFIWNLAIKWNLSG